jgi:hypothetical protein
MGEIHKVGDQYPPENILRFVCVLQVTSFPVKAGRFTYLKYVELYEKRKFPHSP